MVNSTITDQDVIESRLLPTSCLRVAPENPRQRQSLLQQMRRRGWQEHEAQPCDVAPTDERTSTHHQVMLVCDGSTRLAFAREVGILSLRCTIHWSVTTSEGRAALIHRLNTERRSLSPVELFRAMVSEGDETAMRISAALRAHGWAVGTGHTAGSNQVQAVAALRAADAWGVLPETLDVLAAVWPTNRVAKEQMLVAGVAAFVKVYPECDDVRLRRKLEKVSADRLKSEALDVVRLRANGMTSLSEGVMDRIWEHYNRQMAPGKRLPRRPYPRLPMHDGRQSGVSSGGYKRAFGSTSPSGGGKPRSS